MPRLACIVKFLQNLLAVIGKHPIRRAIQEFEEEFEHEQASNYEPSKQELYEQAKALNIPGRSKMSRNKLIKED